MSPHYYIIGIVTLKIGASSEGTASVSEILSKSLIDDCTVLHEPGLLRTERLLVA
jgi:hypothetical protein